MPFAKPERKGPSSRAVSGKIKKGAPLISSGMMKKLEPVLQFQRRTMHCRLSPATIKPLNANQDHVQSLSKKGKEEDVYCFPSSPEGSNTEQTSASKGEREKEKKAERKAKKRYVNKEVLAAIRNTREDIQLLRSQLQVNKNWANQQRFHYPENSHSTNTFKLKNIIIRLRW